MKKHPLRVKTPLPTVWHKDKSKYLRRDYNIEQDIGDVSSNYTQELSRLLNISEEDVIKRAIQFYYFYKTQPTNT